MIIRPALTLVEMVLTLGLLAVLLVPAIMSVAAYRQNQALVSSADIFSSVLTRAHIYSREVKGNRQWGVRFGDRESYELISGKPGSVTVESDFGLTFPTKFLDGYFEVWFLPDTGEVDSEKVIRLISPRGKKIIVNVNKSGLIEVK